MRKMYVYKQVLFVLVIALSALACAGGAVAATETPAPTNTALPTNTATPTPKPTSTKRPTATEIPPTPTPAPIGVPVIYDSLEITVLDVIPHSHIVTGGAYYYYSKPGDTYIDVGVRVRNLNPDKPVRVTWSYIYIVESNGNAWRPLYGDIKSVESGTEYDPFNIGIKTEVNGDDIVVFEKDTYLRLIYYVIDDPEQVILFGIQDSPFIAFQLKK